MTNEQAAQILAHPHCPPGAIAVGMLNEVGLYWERELSEDEEVTKDQLVKHVLYGYPFPDGGNQSGNSGSRG